jgi:integrase
MARQNAGPWYRTSKGAWFTKFEGKQIALGVKGKANRKAAWEAWRKLLAGGRKPNPEAEVPTVRELVKAFLADAKGRMTTGCVRNYRIYLEAFTLAKGNRNADSITATEAEAFTRKPKWSSTYQAGFLGCLVTAYRWAVRQNLIASSPVEHIRKPTKASQGASAVISEAEHKRLIAVADPLMGDYLTVLWHTGARPGEIAGLTAEHVKASTDGVIPLSEHKSAHKGKSRFLILTGNALAIVKARAEAFVSGLIFAGRDGKLTAQAIGSRMRTLCGRAGLRRLKVYGYRHGYATEALTKGVPDAHVAALLGHSDTSMLHKHYSHLTSRTAMLKEAVARVR